jgi:hypothetical protein
MQKQKQKAVRNAKILGMSGYIYDLFIMWSCWNCDSSKNKHAAKHFRGTELPVIKSFEPDEDWKWCYVDETFVKFLSTGEFILSKLRTLLTFAR